jgi:hypothetical protein
MNLFEQIVAVYPELTNEDFGIRGSITLQDDSDGLGAYIAKWEYSEPVPEGLSVGKPKK